MCKKKRQSGFTLIELLVVLAILTVLTSILSLSMAGVKDMTRRITCASNMRQLMLAYQLYSQDKRELPGGGNWVGCITRSDVDGNTSSAVTNGVIYPYTRDISLYRCPASWYDYYVSYTVNWSFGQRAIDPQGTIIRKFTEILDPASALVLLEEFDARGWNWGSMVLKFPGQPDWPVGWPLQWTDSVAGNHKAGYDTTYNGACSPPVPARGDNLAFADGHVEFWVWKEWFTLLGGIGAHDSSRDAPGSTDLLRLEPVFNLWHP